MEIFVPGRICLFGEHTDWAGSFRRLNSNIPKGYTIISGTNQGLYAKVEPHPDKLIYKSKNEKGEYISFELSLDKNELLNKASEGGYFSYIAGVTYQILTHYNVKGIYIDNYETDLPIKKGLSSSAAVCVLVARAFNQIYDLKMTTRGEMEFAYMGELTTPSRCGRMDQGCAYGNKPIVMEYDGDQVSVNELKNSQDIHILIVNLHSEKDTKKILHHLSQAYPFAETEIEKRVQEYLGYISPEISKRATEAINNGNLKELGSLMTETQFQFDSYCQPACPDELLAPKLHSILNFKKIEPYIYGGKGVGSQGDGTAQLLVKDKKSLKIVSDILESEFDVSCIPLIIPKKKSVTKAVIPVAGFGTRMFPASKAVKKELFPIVDKDGIIKPIILILIEEIIESGIDEICLIIQEEDRRFFNDFFNELPSIENFNKLSDDNKIYCNYLQKIGTKISFVVQDKQDGFGHAIYAAKNWVGDSPFLLMLGDHLYSSNEKRSCVKQLLDVYEEYQISVVGFKEEHESNIHQFGCLGGDWKDNGHIINIDKFVEKPDVDYAREHLRINDLKPDHYATVFGQYIIKPEIFELLEFNIKNEIRERGEFQLTSCLDGLRQRDGFLAYKMNGERYDTGNPESYFLSIIKFRKEIL